jgi:glycosyltransferase involved in cell wall biosynthesis
MVKIRVDCYEAGDGSVGGLGTFHNWLYPGLVKLYGADVKTFSMDTKGGLPFSEDFKGVKIERPRFQVSDEQAYAWVSDIFRGFNIDTSYINPNSLAWGSYFTKFTCVPSPIKISEADLFAAHDWFSYGRAGLYSLLLPDIPQDIGLHSTEPGRRSGIFHCNYNGTSDQPSNAEICFNAYNDYGASFHIGDRVIRDLEFILTYKILRKLRDTSALMTVSKLHRKEYLLGVKAHGGKPEEIQNRVYCMYHGVDTDIMRPLNVNKINGFTIGMIGRCTSVKGFDLVPELTAILAHEAPEIKLHIATLTGSNNSLTNELYRRMKEAEVKFPNNLKVEDKAYDEEGKRQLLNSWHGLFAPSRYEPQGQIDLEAMACGIVPFVGLGGLREKVVDGFNGVWIDPFNPKEVADKITQLYKSMNGGPPYRGHSSEAKYDEMCSNARESAEKIWSLSRRVEAHKVKNQYLMEGKAEILREELNGILAPNPLIR